MMVEPNFFHVRGTIRWVSSSDWVPLNDAGHESHNISDVTVFSNRVRVHYGQTAFKVVSCSVTPDESFAAGDVRVGASVGLSYLDIYFYQGSSSTPLNPALLNRAGANVWIDAMMRGHDV